MSEKCYRCSSQFPRAKLYVFRLLPLSKRARNTKTSSFIFMNDAEKQQVLTFKTLKQQFFFTSLFKKMTEMINRLSVLAINFFQSITSTEVLTFICESNTPTVM